jgi:hypothetical protein
MSDTLLPCLIHTQTIYLTNKRTKLPSSLSETYNSQDLESFYFLPKVGAQDVTYLLTHLLFRSQKLSEKDLLKDFKFKRALLFC